MIFWKLRLAPYSDTGAGPNRMTPDTTKLSEKIPAGEPVSSSAWDNAYAEKGRLWGGIPFPVKDLPEHSLILELGCGSGAILSGLTGKEYGLIALDYSFPACRLARSAIKNNPAADVLAADARAIPLKNNSVDAVIARHVAGHLIAGDRSILFAEAARVLKGGGLFLFCDFSDEDFRAGKGIEIEPGTFRRRTGIITHYFTEAEVQKIQKPFTLRKIATHRWSLTVRGRRYPRAEIVAAFQKT